MRVLVADTTWATVSVACELSLQNLLVLRAGDAMDLLHYAEVTQPNVVVFDARITGGTPLDIIRKLRHASPRIGLIMVGSGEDVGLRVRALEIGADDVVSDSADPREIVARIRAIARRRAGHALPRIELGDLTIDLESRTIGCACRPMRLSRLEYELLEVLALNAGQVVEHEQLMTHLYALTDEPGSRILGTYICRIRSAITRHGGDAGMLETVWGRGYRLVAPAEARPMAA